MTATKWTKRSLAAQAMGKIDPTTRGVVPPIHISTTYIRDEDNGYSTGFIYGRPDNETVHEAQAVLAMLEEAKAGALLFGSGMAAATAVFQALSPGDHVVASKVMYWALRAWLLNEATRWGIKVDFVETDDLAALKAAVKSGATKLGWIETPSNPLWTITDIAGAAEIALFGAREKAEAAARPPVLIFGAGHTGRALAKALAPLPVSVSLIDDRDDVMNGLPAAVTCIRMAAPVDAVASAPAKDGAAVCPAGGSTARLGSYSAAFAAL